MNRFVIAAMLCCTGAIAPPAAAADICVNVTVSSPAGGYPAGHCQGYAGAVDCYTRWERIEVVSIEVGIIRVTICRPVVVIDPPPIG